MSNEKTPAVQKQREVSVSERFTAMIMQQYSSTGQPYSFTERERQLIRNYFICIDQMLQRTEAERLRKNEKNRDHDKYDNRLPYTWKTIDLPQLAQDLAHYARVGLDMMEDNTLFPVPYKNNKGNMYSITLMEGYNGIRYQAEKYALDPFTNVTVEVIYANDKFRPIKKDSRNPVEGYEFDIPSPLDRGDPIGVFGYIAYEDATKNKLVIFSKADVEKRKPKYASPEFWGGKKLIWENGRQVEVELDGWVAEMYEKTMKREIYSSKRIPRDPAKIDEHYQYVRNREMEYADIALEAEVSQNANRAPVVIPDQQPEALEEPKRRVTLDDYTVSSAQETAPAELPNDAMTDDDAVGDEFGADAGF